MDSFTKEHVILWRAAVLLMSYSIKKIAEIVKPLHPSWFHTPCLDLVNAVDNTVYHYGWCINQGTVHSSIVWCSYWKWVLHHAGNVSATMYILILQKHCRSTYTWDTYNSKTDSNKPHVDIKFFTQNDLRSHLLELWHEVTEHLG